MHDQSDARPRQLPHGIAHLTIKGFKSFACLNRFPLAALNVLIGENGSGKSNFISFFDLLGELQAERLQTWTARQGAAERILTFGVKHTSRLEAVLESSGHCHAFALEPAVDGSLVFADERFALGSGGTEPDWVVLGSGHAESRWSGTKQAGRGMGAAEGMPLPLRPRIYHFHDTSQSAGVKRLGSLHDNAYLRSDASNLAAFLHKLARKRPDIYSHIREIVQLAIPFFDDFILAPHTLPTEEEQIRLLWRQRDSDYPFWPSQLSDGSLRFICLATALLQPDPPSTIIIDEPELGLHPHAITLLASLLRTASRHMQVIVSTQSVPLVNEFTVADLVVVEREQGTTTLSRRNEADLVEWLEEYSLGELWQKNILAARNG